MPRDPWFWALAAFLVFFVVRQFLAIRARTPGPIAKKKVEEGAVLLDVRTEGEFRSGAIPGAKNVPLHTLGSRLGELDRERPVVLYCASGMRSASAARLLKRNGFREVHDIGPASAWPM